MTVSRPLLRRQGRSRRGRAFLVRPATADDATALVALRDAVAAEGRWIVARPGEATVLEETLALAALLAEGGLSLCLVVDDRVVGNVVVRRAPGEEAVGDVGIAVARDARGEGLGRVLMETAVAWAKAVQLRRLRLSVLSDNQPAIALYRSLGFTNLGVQRLAPRPWDEERDVLVMNLDLATGPRGPEVDDDSGS